MVGFLKRVERNFFFQNFLRFFPYFLSSIFLSNFFFVSQKLYFSTLFYKKKRGNVMAFWYTITQPPIFATSIGYFIFFPIFGPIFVRLFEGLSDLRFLQNLYPWKTLDFLFPQVLTLQDLELRSSKYCAQKGGDAVQEIL